MNLLFSRRYLGSIITYLGGTAGITAIFGATGFGLAGSKMAKRTEGVTEFEFKLLRGEQRLPVFVFVSGFLRPRSTKTKIGGVIAAVGNVMPGEKQDRESGSRTEKSNEKAGSGARGSGDADVTATRPIETKQSSFLASNTLRAGHWQVTRCDFWQPYDV